MSPRKSRDRLSWGMERIWNNIRSTGSMRSDAKRKCNETEAKKNGVNRKFKTKKIFDLLRSDRNTM